MNGIWVNYYMRDILSVRVDPATRELVFLRAEKVEVAKLPTCQFCSADARYDAKTKMGPWAYMCETHFRVYGVGLGLGKGQKLEPCRDTSYYSQEPSPTIIQRNQYPNRP